MSKTEINNETSIDTYDGILCNEAQNMFGRSRTTIFPMVFPEPSISLFKQLVKAFSKQEQNQQ